MSKRRACQANPVDGFSLIPPLATKQKFESLTTVPTDVGCLILCFLELSDCIAVSYLCINWKQVVLQHYYPQMTTVSVYKQTPLAVLRYSRRLVQIDLHDTTHTKISTVKECIQRNASTLQHVKFYDQRLESVMYECRHLQKLWTMHEDKFPAAMLHFCELRELSIPSTFMTSTVAILLTSISLLKHLETLTASIEIWRNLGDKPYLLPSTLREIRSHQEISSPLLPMLQIAAATNLKIEGVTATSDETAILETLLFVPHLKTLQYNGRLEVPFRLIAPRLTSLKVWSCENLVLRDLQAPLKVLSIFDSWSVLSIVALPPTLTELSFGGFQFEENEMKQVLQQTQLTSLKIYSLASRADSKEHLWFYTLVSTLPHLRDLDYWCTLYASYLPNRLKFAVPIPADILVHTALTSLECNGLAEKVLNQCRFPNLIHASFANIDGEGWLTALTSSQTSLRTLDLKSCTLVVDKALLLTEFPLLNEIHL